MRPIACLAPLALLAALQPAAAAPDDEAEFQVDFVRDVQPILELNCVSCHREGKDEGDLRLDTKKHALEWPEIVNPGKPEESLVYTTTVLEPDDRDIMPPQEEDDDYPLPKSETEILRLWIAQGAKWPDGVTLVSRRPLPQKVDFVEHVQPILELKCVKCHREGNDEGDLRLDTKKHALEWPEIIDPGKPLESLVYTTTVLPPGHRDIMPPEEEEPLPVEEIAMLRRWIEQGASWPDGVELVPRKPPQKIAGIDPRELYEKLRVGATVFKPEDMRPYTVKLRGTDVSFDMVPIPAGTFRIGSPPGETGRGDDEGPQRNVKIDAFWMGKYEVTWDEYELWMLSLERDNRSQGIELTEADLLADAVTRPTAPYRDMTFGMGKKGFPAICMTQLAAKVYCMWLSAKTGHFYRLPTEAEWEYACRAGTTTAYHFGDDAADIDKYAWFEDNSDFQYQKVGTKLPNPWGLHDMHGNVWEWVLDQYAPRAYEGYNAELAVAPITLPTELYPRTVRGGSWDDPPERLRSAARLGSHPDWKQQDPQIPKSVWYHTDALYVGFRVVRPRVLPEPDELGKYWPTLEEFQAIPQR